MKGYYRVMPGRKCMYGAECFAGGFIGTTSEEEMNDLVSKENAISSEPK